MALINCEINLILTWSANCVIVSTDVANKDATFSITDTKLYVLVVTLAAQDNTKLHQELKSGFKIIINWNKYQQKSEFLGQNQYLNQLVEPSFDDVQRISEKIYCLPNVRIKDCNIMIDGKKTFFISQ